MIWPLLMSGFVDQVQENLGQLAAAITGKWPAASVHLFGSQACGLALPLSDMDVVVLGLSEELLFASGGFSL